MSKAAVSSKRASWPPEKSIQERQQGRRVITSIDDDGQVVEKPAKRPKGTAHWPMVSVAAGVLPSQREEYRDYLERRGVPTEINADGDPIWRTRGHRKRVMEVIDMHDNDGSYGD